MIQIQQAKWQAAGGNNIMKRINNLFEQVIKWEHLYDSFRQAMKGTGKTDASCKFFFYYEKEITRLQKELDDESYQPGRYHYYKIHDPKKQGSHLNY